MNVIAYSWFRSDFSGYESEKAGDGRGVFFLSFMPTLVRAHYYVWGDTFELRIYHDDRVIEFPYFLSLRRMHEAKLLKLVSVGHSQTLCGSMLFRMSPIFESEVKFLLCRDIDGLSQPRERVMVEEFIGSGKSVHAILDSESHVGPLMGGTCGFNVEEVQLYLRNHGINNLESFSDCGFDLNIHGADQKVLNGRLWSVLKDKTFVHQKGSLLKYPEAGTTRQVAPKIDPLDYVVHIGAAYPTEKAMAILKDTPADKLVSQYE